MVRVVSLVFAVSFAAACEIGDVPGAGDARPPRDGAAATDARPDATPPGDRDVQPIDGRPAGQGDLVAVEIAPADPTVSTDGVARATVALTAVGVDARGVRAPIATGAWSLAREHLGAIAAATGEFTANGAAGGVVEVRVEAPGPGGAVLRASTRLTVNLAREYVAPGTPADAAARFARAAMASDPARAPAVLYPLDAARMPNNVPPPDVQWNRGAWGAADVFRVRVARPHAAATAYVGNTGATFQSRWLVDRAAWRAVAESDPDEPVVFTVDRLDAARGEVVAGAPVRVSLARGSVYGAVYYWDLSDGAILRLNADTAARENFVPRPPPNAAGGRCMGCHTVSRDGRYMAASRGGDSALLVFDLTAALGTDPAPTRFAPDPARNFASFGAFNPDSTRLIVHGNTGALRMLDPRTGAAVSAAGLSTAQADWPSWSPDGSLLAYVAGTNNGGGVEHTTGDALTVQRQTGPDAFGPPTVIHRASSLAGAPEGGSVDSHPTWSPDGRLLAFAHGAHYEPTGRRFAAPGALYTARADGTALVRLSNASGGARGGQAYYPTFSPFVTAAPGGAPEYYWLAFHSQRDYGNEQAGTRGTGRRQLWVTAVRVGASAGEDPSSVPYWLPGQSTAVENIAAQWAPLACRANGAECNSSSECCSESCRPDPASPTRFVCQPPTSTMACRRGGQTCGGSAECCSGLMCQSNVCVAPPG